MNEREKALLAKKQKAADMIGKHAEADMEIRAVEIDEEKKTAVFVMSTASIDRHGDIVDQDSWIFDHFLKNPVAFLQHESYKFPVGKWPKIWLEADPDNADSKRLVGNLEFAVDDQGWLGEDVERAWRHVKRGDMNMVSVGFIPHRVEYDEHKDVFVLYDCELLECSLVGIGSNRYALAKEKEKAEDPIKKAIDAKNALDQQIKESDNKFIVARLKARENLDKAIRHLKIGA